MKIPIEAPQSDYYSSDDHSADSREESVFKLVEPSPSSNSHEKGGPPSSDQVTIALITDCPTVIIHVGKCYKALINSIAVISLVRYSTYQTIENNFKTAITVMPIQLNTADGSPLTALGMTGLQLRIADFKFLHIFIICDKLPKIEQLFGIHIQKKYSLSYAWDKEKNCYIQEAGKFLTYTVNCE